VGEARIERQYDGCVHLEGFEEAQALAKARKQRRRLLGSKNLKRVSVESQYDRRQVGGSSLRDAPSDHLLVSEVHPIEYADGYASGGGEWLSAVRRPEERQHLLGQSTWVSGSRFRATYNVTATANTWEETDDPWSITRVPDHAGSVTISGTRENMTCRVAAVQRPWRTPSATASTARCGLGFTRVARYKTASRVAGKPVERLAMRSDGAENVS
jgi:hypothetical protein